jgi:hypothetical protein
VCEEGEKKGGKEREMENGNTTSREKIITEREMETRET